MTLVEMNALAQFPLSFPRRGRAASGDEPAERQVTAALEDYLEAIFNLTRFQQAARSRDIAERLGVHKSTVTAALKALGALKLINYAPYEVITLTDDGERIASDVVKRHDALKSFFTDVLMVDEGLAEKAACGMEHSIPKEIVSRLAEFGDFVKECPRGGRQWLSEFVEKCKKLESSKRECGSCLEVCLEDYGKRSEDKERVLSETLTLDKIAVGSKVKVKSIAGEGVVRRRLVEMGLTPGSVVEVERVAPLGDPLDVRVKGYRLSLRKEEALRVTVTREQG